MVKQYFFRKEVRSLEAMLVNHLYSFYSIHKEYFHLRTSIFHPSLITS